MLEKIKNFFKGLSTRTGIILLILCIISYAIAFIVPFIAIPKATKTVLAFTFFGLAKVFQYSAIAVLGVKGWHKFKAKLGLKQKETNETDTSKQ